jgi:hypothetical protein
MSNTQFYRCECEQTDCKHYEPLGGIYDEICTFYNDGDCTCKAAIDELNQSEEPK